jgi:hypothetical protein
MKKCFNCEKNLYCKECGKPVDWQDNILNKILNDFNHDFSICNIDGAARWEPFKFKDRKKRFIIYEVKWEKEKLGPEQRKTLCELIKCIKWEMYDSESGVYTIKLLEKPVNKCSDIKICKLNQNGKEEFVCNTWVNRFYKVVSGKMTFKEASKA